MTRAELALWLIIEMNAVMLRSLYLTLFRWLGRPDQLTTMSLVAVGMSPDCMDGVRKTKAVTKNMLVESPSDYDI